MCEENFKKYKKIKNDLSKINYKKIRLDRTTSSFLAHYFLIKTSPIILFLKIIRNLFFIPRLDISFINKKNVYIYSVKRNDQKDLFNFYQNKLKKKFSIYYLSNRKLRIFISIKNMLIAYYFIKKINRYPLNERFLIFCSILAGINFYSWLEKKISNKKIYTKFLLSYNSSFLYESVINVFLQVHGLKTYSLQHAFYCKYEKNIPYDVINYENVQANFLLQWSQYSINSVKGHISKYTKQVNFGYFPKNYFRNNYEKKSKNILISLPRKLYFAENQKLINIITNSIFDNFLFYLAKHPQDNNNYYYGNKPNIVLVDGGYNRQVTKRNYRALIAFNSSCMFLSTLYNIPPLIYLSCKNEFQEKKFFYFNRKETLLKLLTKNNLNKYCENLKKSFF